MKNNTSKLTILLTVPVLLYSFNEISALAESTDIVIPKTQENKNYRYLTLSQLIKIFTGDSDKWENGEEIHLVMYDINSIEHKTFLLEQLGLTPTEFKKRFNKNLKENPKMKDRITYVKNQEEMIKELLNNNSAIGYMFNLILYKNKDDLIVMYIDN